MLFLLRHGETDFNINRVAQGQLQTPVLTDRGRWQIEKAAQYLASQKISFHKVVVSDSRRALQSWDIIKSKINYNQFNVDSRIRECYQGELEGIEYSSPKWKTYQKALDEADLIFPMFSPQPESPVDFRNRIVSALEDLMMPNTANLAITHGGCIRNYLAHLKNISVREYLQSWRKKLHIDNGSIILCYSKGNLNHYAQLI